MCFVSINLLSGNMDVIKTDSANITNNTAKYVKCMLGITKRDKKGINLDKKSEGNFRHHREN